MQVKRQPLVNLANVIRKKHNKKPLLVAADVYRPAAIQQLETLGKQLTIPVFALGTDISPVEIVRQALEEAEKEHHDVVIIDTAGSLHVDEILMQELEGYP